MPSPAVQRISVRWLPEPAYENTETITLNVGGFFIDLRVNKETRSIQWSRAGKRILLKYNPPTFRWTHIIDSLDPTVPDEAYFEKLPNGDDLEIGSSPCPHKRGAVTDYVEVWQDITSKTTSDRLSWILQSAYGTTFVGRVGGINLAIRKASAGSFSAHREDFEPSSQSWQVSFESGDVKCLPRSNQAVEEIEVEGRNWTEADKVKIEGVEYVVMAVSAE